MTAIDLLRWLGETSRAISILTLLVLIIRKPFARLFGARAAYALWLAPAARLFLPELKLLPAPDAAPPVTEPLAEPAPVTAAQGWDTVVSPLPSNVEFFTNGFDWLALAAGAGLFLWAAVAVALFSFALERQGEYLRARLAASTPASPAIAAMTQAIAKELRLARVPQIRVSMDDEDGPCLVGLFRPVIFLPAGFDTAYAPAERRLVLAHELAHVARGDMAATLAALAFKAAQWPNPLAHIFFAAFRTDQEAACDAFVLARCGGGEGNYAAAILKSIRREIRAPQAALALAHPVKERIMLLKSRKKSSGRLAAGAAAAAIFTTVSLAATASYGFAETQDMQTSKETKKKSYGRTVISVDEGETLEIPGYDNATMIDVERKDGVRTVRVYGDNRKLLTENVYGPAQTMPYDEVVVVKNGERKTININGEAPPAHPAEPVPPVPPVPGAAYQVIVAGDAGEHDFTMANCDNAPENGPIVMAWKSTDGEETITREVICLDDKETDPKKRAENLRKMIAQLEENAKREEERREAMIARLKEQLKETEKQQ
ncbi:M56 family metallopeptidase [Hyphococcus sp.]|uniref:M56 family metallopeptidase n=1 Tax=Hyphococcus sp. TaxID=2038636 RepID=UPI0035C706B7